MQTASAFCFFLCSCVEECMWNCLVLDSCCALTIEIMRLTTVNRPFKSKIMPARKAAAASTASQRLNIQSSGWYRIQLRPELSVWNHVNKRKESQLSNRKINPTLYESICNSCCNCCFEGFPPLDTRLARLIRGDSENTRKLLPPLL